MEVKYLFFLLLVCLANFQVVLGVLSKVTVKEGENATLPCSTSFQGGILYKTTWFKGTQKLMVIQTARTPGLPPSIYKYSQRKNPYSLVGQQSLWLTGVDRHDHGNYSCTAVYLLHNFDFKSVKEDVMLLVKAHPIISTTSPSIQNITKSEKAHDLKLHCSVSAFPKAGPTWQRIDGQLPIDRTNQEPNGTLLIRDVSAEDSGTYICAASNELGEDQVNFTVTIFEQPRIFGKRKFHANVGEAAKLICVSRGNPAPAFTWSWNNADNNTIIIRQGEEISGYSVTTLHGNTTSQSTLEIVKVTKESWMIYTCEVVNAIGTSTAYISLSGKTRPESPTILSVETSVTGAVVTWKFGDDGGLELTALKLQYKKDSQSDWQEIQIKPPNKVKYIIMDLEPNTNYKFRILATNSLGTSPPSSIYLKTTKSESNTSAHAKKGLAALTDNMTVLIAAVVGGFLVIIIAIIGVFCFVRKVHKNSTPRNTPVNSRPTSQREQAEMTSLLTHTIPNIPLPQPLVEQGATASQLSNNPWEFPRNRVDLQVVLGSGAFGLVMKAQAQGIKGCVGKMYVAVKIVKENDSETARRDLLAELELLKLIEPHPNVIGLLGCCTRTEPLMVIVEFCAYGDLQSYLRHCRGVEDKYYEDLYKVPADKLGSRDLLSFAIQTARGMAHLAGMKVVHRDLAARNVLIDENKVCKVADFGFARDIYVEDHYTRKTQGGRFPIKWMAIESLLDGVSTSKSDVWSFGIVLWEIVTLGASPYPGMNSQEVINFLQDSYRMDKPKHCSEELYVLMLDCWQVAPQRRPTFPELSQHLSKMLSDEREYVSLGIYEDNMYINFDGSSLTV
ncbi:fibroblast growth factor receptor 2-like isoform X2 [Orbicella faveolata]|uniref:fibroblast growth factor receptor 2-like isoform X2 n=1 Tax=Orbicella faveolata TaxID=48498 RepID=UPI0009E378A9|nr:fibroblast growth factor receptor 2-like isoform X2 [Orbicella faveolata]